MDQRENLYLPLSGKKKTTADDQKVTKGVVQEYLGSGESIEKVMSEMKVVYLDATEVIPKSDPTKKRGKRLSAAERRDMRIYDIPKGVKYDHFMPLHNLWQGYMKELYSQGQNTQQFAQKLLKADFHGAIVKVTKSSNPVLVSATGIVVQETQNLFKIITKEDRLKSIPKAKTVFQVELDVCKCTFTLYGQQLLTRSAERAAKKFKAKPTIDL